VPLVVAGTLLFFCGVAFCHFFVFGQVFTFIANFAPKSITPAPDIDAYLTFVLTMFLAFGVTFEIPIVVILLVRFGLVTVEQLTEWRSYVILGNAVIAAVITPPDVVSMLALLIPMCLLYEAGLFVARFVHKRQEMTDLSQKQT
jgi:sec-independent protein translocase protein TatC